MYRIALRVVGVDLEDDGVLEQLGRCQADVVWSVVDGRTIVTFYTDCSDPVGAGVQAARSVVGVCPAVSVIELDPDLVNIADVAKRIGVNRETVRLWIEGRRGPGGFPPEFGTVGEGDRGPSRIWIWADVNVWLRENYSLGDKEEYLTADQRADLNARLRRIKQDIDKEWEAVQMPARDICLGAETRESPTIAWGASIPALSHVSLPVVCWRGTTGTPTELEVNDRQTEDAR